MTEKEYSYAYLAKEVRKLYEAFTKEGFSKEEALSLANTCVEKIPMFSRLIKTVDAPKKPIGYIVFDDGSREEIYSYKTHNQYTTDYNCDTAMYRHETPEVMDMMSFGKRIVNRWYKFDYAYSKWNLIDNVASISLEENLI